MSVESRELYGSPNGDRWHLVREPRSGRVFIKHEPNAASGGDISLIEVGEFLAENHGPQHGELLRLIGTLITQEPADSQRSRKRGSRLLPSARHTIGRMVAGALVSRLLLFGKFLSG